MYGDISFLNNMPISSKQKLEADIDAIVAAGVTNFNEIVASLRHSMRGPEFRPARRWKINRYLLKRFMDDAGYTFTVRYHGAGSADIVTGKEANSHV